MIKLIAKHLTSKTMFGSDCSYFKSFVRASINDVYTALYNIMSIVHPLLVDDLMECHISFQNNSMSFPDRVENILTYVERKDLIGRPFTKFQKFDLSIE